MYFISQRSVPMVSTITTSHSFLNVVQTIIFNGITYSVVHKASSGKDEIGLNNLPINESILSFRKFLKSANAACESSVTSCLSTQQKAVPPTVHRTKY